MAEGWQGLKYTNWNLFPKKAQWKVIKNVKQPKRETTTANYDSLQLIYGESRFIGHSISKNSWTKRAVNTIDYAYIKDKLAFKLNSITEKQVKEDIENWYGGYVAYLLRYRIQDFQTLIDLLQKKTILNNNGVKESVFERVLNDYQFRNNFYSHFRLDNNYRKVLNKLLTSQGTKDTRTNIKEVIGLLKSWVYQLKEIQNSIKVEIIWHESPKKVHSWNGKYGEFPAFAFNFEQKITWVKEMKLPLNGTWDTENNKYIKPETPENKDNYKFDLTSKLTHLKEFLTPLTSTIGSLSGNLKNINVMEDLIPDLGKFVGIDALTISQNESISYHYQTKSSPITLALDDISDLREQNFKGMNIGWKAIDVSAGLNLSNFSKLFFSLYEKFDLGVEKKTSALGYGDLTKIGEELKKSPISFIAHAINSIFDKSYKSGGKRLSEEQRPWPVFFRSLFEDHIVFNHSQMTAGYSTLFFKYPEWWDKGNNKDSCNVKEQKEKEIKQWCSNFNFDEKGEIAEPINDEVRLISRSLTFNHSIYLPYSPIILDGTLNGGQYEQFLKGAGNNSRGLLNGEREIIQATKQEYMKNSLKYPGKREVDWEKVKVSFAQLNLKKAIESVLALKNTWSGIGTNFLVTTAGIYFHKILGEALVRDGFWINVNLMHEHGMFAKHDAKITKRMTYFPNSEIWLKANPYLDHKKLNVGWLIKDYLK